MHQLPQRPALCIALHQCLQVCRASHCSLQGVRLSHVTPGPQTALPPPCPCPCSPRVPGCGAQPPSSPSPMLSRGLGAPASCPEGTGAILGHNSLVEITASREPPFMCFDTKSSPSPSLPAQGHPSCREQRSAWPPPAYPTSTALPHHLCFPHVPSRAGRDDTGTSHGDWKLLLSFRLRFDAGGGKESKPLAASDSNAQ